MISFGKDKYKPALKEMWKLCFPKDTNNFIKFYFNEVYKDDETLIYLENGKPAAAFQMIPYPLKSGAEVFQACYISGAMTHPDFQRRRFMRELLLFAFDLMRERGFDYTFLIPQEKWLFDFYGKFGYKITDAVRMENEYHREEKNPDNPIDYHSISDTTALYQIYHSFLSKIPHVVLKTEEQFRQILRDFFDENGILFADEQGIAFTIKEENCIAIKEFFYQDQKIRNLFLKIIYDYYSQEEILVLNSSDDLVGKRGMIKRLNSDAPQISALYINMMLD
jgi:predicted acetyltransferase